MAYIRNASWVNDDGLAIDFDGDEARWAQVTEYATDGPNRLVEIVINDISKYNATDEYILSEKVKLPKGARITSAWVGDATVTFASSGSGVVSVGTVDADASSNGDIDSIFATASVAELNGGAAGGLAPVGQSPGDGVLVNGAPLTSAKLLTISVDTAVFQAGAGTLYFTYEIPKKGSASDTLVYSKP